MLGIWVPYSGSMDILYWAYRYPMLGLWASYSGSLICLHRAYECPTLGLQFAHIGPTVCLCWVYGLPTLGLLFAHTGPPGSCSPGVCTVCTLSKHCLHQSVTKGMSTNNLHWETAGCAACMCVCSCACVFACTCLQKFVSCMCPDVRVCVFVHPSVHVCVLLSDHRAA